MIHAKKTKIFFAPVKMNKTILKTLLKNSDMNVKKN